MRRIFTERLPTVAAPWARRTPRLAQRPVALGMAFGGRAGVRLSHAWDLAVSRNTLLRRLRRLPRPVWQPGVMVMPLSTPQCRGWPYVDNARTSMV
jgi:hypothetical protein